MSEPSGLTLEQWLEQHPRASAQPALGAWDGVGAGQVQGGVWLYPNGEEARDLFRLADYRVSSRNAAVCFMKPKTQKYGGAIPVAELDLPRREESEVHVAADRLLESPEIFDPMRAVRQHRDDSWQPRGFTDPKLFSPTMPELSDEEWERLKAANRARALGWEGEKEQIRREQEGPLLGRIGTRVKSGLKKLSRHLPSADLRAFEAQEADKFLKASPAHESPQTQRKGRNLWRRGALGVPQRELTRDEIDAREHAYWKSQGRFGTPQR